MGGGGLAGMIGSEDCASGLPDMCGVEYFEIVIGMPVSILLGCKIVGVCYALGLAEC